MKIAEKIARFFFGNLIDGLIGKALYDARIREREEYFRIKNFELESFVGEKLIIISNNWEQPLYATGVELTSINDDDRMALVIKELFTGENFITFGKVFKFSEELNNALLNLTPFERWNVAVPHNPIPWDKKHQPMVEHPTDIKKKLKEKGWIKTQVKSEDFIEP